MAFQRVLLGLETISRIWDGAIREPRHKVLDGDVSNEGNYH